MKLIRPSRAAALTLALLTVFAILPRDTHAQRYGDGSSLRLQVTPRDTEVFIDDYYVGTVDDFDGFFQRLRLEPGEHEVTLYLPGHRTAKQMVYKIGRASCRERV